MHLNFEKKRKKKKKQQQQLLLKSKIWILQITTFITFSQHFHNKFYVINYYLF